MQEYIEAIKRFFKQELFVKDFLAPLRILACLYILISFYIPIGWAFIKNTILLILNKLYSGPILYGTNGTSLFIMWWLYIIDLAAVSYLFYVFIKELNNKGTKKLWALLPIAGELVLMLLFVKDTKKVF